MNIPSCLKRILLSGIFLITLHATAAQTDYYVHYSTHSPFAMSYNAGDISQYDMYDPALIPADGACGMHFIDVEHYAWLTTLGDSVSSSSIDSDVDVYSPFPGCGGGPIEAYFLGNELTKPDAAGILMLDDAEGAYWIDEHGDQISGGSCYPCSAGFSELGVEPKDTSWKLSIQLIRFAKIAIEEKIKLFSANQQVSNAQLKIEDVKARLQKAIAIRRRVDMGRLEKSLVHLETQSLDNLDRAQKHLSLCLTDLKSQRADSAYRQCDLGESAVEGARKAVTLILEFTKDQK